MGVVDISGLIILLLLRPVVRGVDVLLTSTLWVHHVTGHFSPQAGNLESNTCITCLTCGFGLLRPGSLESDTCLTRSQLLRLVVLWQVVHWGWSEGGWASPYRCDFALTNEEYVDCRADARPLLLGCGATDFAGAGIVHMTGGAQCPTFFFPCPPTDGYLPCLQCLHCLQCFYCLQCFQGKKKHYQYHHKPAIIPAFAAVSSVAGNRSLDNLLSYISPIALYRSCDIVYPYS